MNTQNVQVSQGHITIPDMIFGNLKNEGHYDLSPYNYVTIKDIKVKTKNTITLKDAIVELIEEQKNEKRN